MRAVSYLRISLVLLVLGGCHPEPPPEPPVAPAPEDLSAWSVPALIPPRRQPAQVAPVLLANLPAGTAEKVYTFAPGVAVEALVSLGIPLDIVLQPGEQVRDIVGGDRSPLPEGQQHPRWEVKQGKDQAGTGLRMHVFVTVTEPGLINGLTITTTRRTYYVTCKSVAKAPYRVVRWHYAGAERESTLPEVVPEPPLLPLPDQPMRYHVGYELAVSQPAPSWVPRFVGDDGQKTYLVYPEVTLHESVPLVRGIGPNGPHLVNARQYLNVVIIDQLLGRAELRLGTGERAQVVTITRGALRTITCPGDAACPVFPAAAAQLAGGNS